MTKMLDLIEDYLCLREVAYCRLDGQCNIEDRQQSVSISCTVKLTYNEHG